MLVKEAPGILSFPHCVLHWLIRPSAHMILTMKGNKILVFHEKSPSYKDGFILHICRISSSLRLKLYLHCQAINTHDIDYSQYNGYWLPGEARSHDGLKSESSRSGHQGQYHHHIDVIMTTMASQITSLTVVYSTVYFRRRSKKTSKPRVTGLCAGNSPGPVNSPHKGTVTRKMFPFDDVIMMAADAVALAPYVFVVNTFLIEHKDLFIPHSQYHGCRWPGNAVIHFVISVSRSDSEITNRWLSAKLQ